MWQTLDGLRVLRGAEFDLVRGAIGMMVDHLVAEYRDDAEAWHYGIELFDCWDAEQRIWLIEKVTLALLTRKRELPAAAIWEATVDAIFCEIVDLIEIEITDPSPTQAERSWRRSVIEAFECQNKRLPSIHVGDGSISNWRRVVSQIADAVLFATAYQKVEAFRDGDYEKLEQFLSQRGLPPEYVDRIPPLRSPAQTQASIDRIQKIVFKVG